MPVSKHSSWQSTGTASSQLNAALINILIITSVLVRMSSVKMSEGIDYQEIKEKGKECLEKQ